MRLLLAFITLCLLYLTISTDGAVVRANDAFPHDAIVRQSRSRRRAIDKVLDFFADKLKDKEGRGIRKRLQSFFENLDMIPFDDDNDDSDSNEGKGNKPEDSDNPDNEFGIDPPSPDEGNSRDDDNGGGQDDTGGCCSDNDLPDSF